MTEHPNIMKALQQAQGDKMLSLDQRAENYRLFDEMMKEGVYLPNLVSRIKELEDKVREMQVPRSAPMDEELFFVMEDAVKDDEDVIKARNHREHILEVVLTEFCLKDSRFAEADRAYHTLVNSTYVRRKSGKDQP